MANSGTTSVTTSGTTSGTTKFNTRVYTDISIKDIDGTIRVPFSAKISVTVVKEVNKELNEVTINRIIDIPSELKLIVRTKEVGNVIVAEGDAYTLMGDWTRAQVYYMINQRLSGVVTNTVPKPA